MLEVKLCLSWYRHKKKDSMFENDVPSHAMSNIVWYACKVIPERCSKTNGIIMSCGNSLSTQGSQPVIKCFLGHMKI